jgi:hypothetical protein
MLRGGTSVVLVQFPNVSVHPFNAGDEVVDPVVNPVMYERILVVDVRVDSVLTISPSSFFSLSSLLSPPLEFLCSEGGKAMRNGHPEQYSFVISFTLSQFA